MLIVLLLLLSGNVQPNPGPELQFIQTPSDFKSFSGLKFFHLNARSLVPKIDMVKIWAESTDAYVIVISETWLSLFLMKMLIGLGTMCIVLTGQKRWWCCHLCQIKIVFLCSLV